MEPLQIIPKEHNSLNLDFSKIGKCVPNATNFSSLYKNLINNLVRVQKDYDTTELDKSPEKNTYVLLNDSEIFNNLEHLMNEMKNMKQDDILCMSDVNKFCEKTNGEALHRDTKKYNDYRVLAKKYTKLARAYKNDLLIKYIKLSERCPSIYERKEYIKAKLNLYNDLSKMFSFTNRDIKFIKDNTGLELDWNNDENCGLDFNFLCVSMLCFFIFLIILILIVLKPGCFNK